MTMDEHATTARVNIFDEINSVIEMRRNVFASVVFDCDVHVFVFVSKSRRNGFGDVKNCGDSKFIEKFLLGGVVGTAEVKVGKNGDRA